MGDYVAHPNYGTPASKFVDPQFLQRIYTLLYQIKHADVLEYDEDDFDAEDDEAMEIERLASQLNEILAELEKGMIVQPGFGSVTQRYSNWICAICQTAIRVNQHATTYPQEYTCPGCKITYTIDWQKSSVKTGK